MCSSLLCMGSMHHSLALCTIHWPATQQCAALLPPAGQVKYIWPIQTPVTDFDAQRKRVAAVREQLRWQLIGCELIECYQ